MSLASPELAADFVLLYGPGMHELELWHVRGEPVVRTEQDLRQTGYPDPKGSYLCLPLEQVAAGAALGHVEMQAIDDFLPRLKLQSATKDKGELT